MAGFLTTCATKASPQPYCKSQRILRNNQASIMPIAMGFRGAQMTPAHERGFSPHVRGLKEQPKELGPFRTPSGRLNPTAINLWFVWGRRLGLGAPGVWPSIFGLGAKQFNGFRMCSGFRLVSGFGCQLLWFRGVVACLLNGLLIVAMYH